METWGSLPKNQTDPQTLDEAIASAISAHEADPTAHTGTDESLSAHRQYGVLDHVPGSVLADKWTMSELDFSTSFDTLDVFTTHGTPYALYPGVHIEPTASGDANYCKVEIDLETRQLIIDFAKDFTFQFAFSGDIYSTGSLLMNFGFTPTEFSKIGVGLEINNTNKRFYASNADGSTLAHLNWTTYEDATPYVIRIQNIASEDKVYIYINGELLGTITLPAPSASDVGHIIFASKRSGATGGVIELYNLFFSLSL